MSDAVLMGLALLSWLASCVAVVGAIAVRGHRMPPCAPQPPARPCDREALTFTTMAAVRFSAGEVGAKIVAVVRRWRT